MNDHVLEGNDKAEFYVDRNRSWDFLEPNSVFGTKAIRQTVLLTVLTRMPVLSMSKIHPLYNEVTIKTTLQAMMGTMGAHYRTPSTLHHTIVTNASPVCVHIFEYRHIRSVLYGHEQTDCARRTTVSWCPASPFVNKAPGRPSDRLTNQRSCVTFWWSEYLKRLQLTISVARSVVVIQTPSKYRKRCKPKHERKNATQEPSSQLHFHIPLDKKHGRKDFVSAKKNDITAIYRHSRLDAAPEWRSLKLQRAGKKKKQACLYICSNWAQ